MRLFRRLFFVLLVSGGLGAGAKCSQSAQASLLGTLDSLHYVIRTQVASDSSVPTCGTEYLTSAVIGVPSLLNIVGSVAPDISVSVVAVPGVGGAPTTLRTDIVKLDGTPLKALVEVILNPSGDASRVAFGYDGCEQGIPKSFGATITSSDAKLTLDTTIKNPASALTILGSAFTLGANDARQNPTALSARLSPVPQTLSAVVNFLPNNAYSATVTPSAPTDVNVGFTQVAGPKSTTLSAALKRLPGRIDFDFSPSVIHYKTTAPFTTVHVILDSYTPRTPTVTGATDHLDLDLTNVPAESTVTRAGKKIEFTPASGNIGTTLATYSSREDGGAPLGALTVPVAAQYVAGNVQIGSIRVQTRILGLSHAIVDTGDPVVVDVTHTAGLLVMNVVQRAHASDADPMLVRRSLFVTVHNMPAKARVTYSPATGDYSYTGSSIITDLTADLTSSVPLVDDATMSHLHLVSVPTGLTGRVDSAGQTFTAQVTAGAIGLIELQVTNGANDRLPDGVDGVMLHNHPGSYVAFVRISGLSNAAVGWGDTQFATLTHTAGKFLMQVAQDDTDVEGITIDGAITNLPATAHVEYTPSHPARLLPEPRAFTPSNFTYSGSDAITSVDFTVVKATPLASGANTFLIHARSVPTGTTLIGNEATGTTTATITGGAIGLLTVEACSAGDCPLRLLVPPHGFPPFPDGAWISQRTHSFDAYLRLSGLSAASVTQTTDTTAASMTHAAGPFEVHTITDKVAHHTHPFPFPDTDVAYVEKADVVAHDLPATVALSYGDVAQHLTYTGDTTIGELTVDYSKGVEYIAGRAPTMHLDLTNVGTNIDLTYQFTNGGDAVTLDTGASKIGHVALDLLSDPSLLNVAGVASNEIYNGSDGLVMWDLNDGSDAIDGINDPYILSARVTNLQHFSYHTVAGAPEGIAADPNRGVDVTRLGGGPNIFVDIRQLNTSKGLKTIDGFANQYKYEETTAEYDSPPDELGFLFTNRIGAGTNDPVKQFLIKAWGSSEGGLINFETNAGSLNDLNATVFPVPAGTPSDPGVNACASPNTIDQAGDEDYSCVTVPSAYTRVPDAFPLGVSGDLKVHEPVHIDFVLDSGAGGDNTRVTANIDVSSHLAFAHSKNTSGADSQLVYINTDGTPVAADIVSKSGGTRDVEVHAPANTRALSRWVEIEDSGVNDSFNYGMLLCPFGFTSDAYAFHGHGHLSLNDDICSSSIITSTSPASIRADGLPHTIDIYGWGMVDRTTESNGTDHKGTHILLGGVDLDGPVWLSPTHMQVTVVFNPGEEGTYNWWRENPTDESRVSEDTPAECSCTLTVT